MDKNLLKKADRKKVFGRQAIYVIFFLLTAIFLFMGTVTIAGALSGIIPEWLCLALLSVEGALTLTAYVLIRKFLIDPYKHCRSLFLQFTKNDTYKQLIDSPLLIFEEQQAVINHFNALLDQKNIIDLSTKQAELLALQNQINPHFLYNTLEAIRSDALCAGIDSIANTTEALSTFFRYTITDTRNLVTVGDELDNIENYFKIQQYRFGEKFTMNIEFESDELLSLKLPKLTLQPFVENAIFHGLESKSEGGHVDIGLETTRMNLLISIRDNGIGISEDKLNEINDRLDRVSISFSNEISNKKGGIALNNIARRIKLLFGENYGFHLYSISGLGTDVRIKIPIIH